ALLPRDRAVLVMLALFGAALLYGDGVITPAISVLGAVEGLEVMTPALAHLVVPVSVVILLALFVVQRRGTAGVGSVFGPTMLMWFATIAVLGGGEVARTPSGLLAPNAALAIGCLLLVVSFRSSSALGAAYGIAVTGTMAITSVLFYAIARARWRWSALRAGALTAGFLALELAFLAANVPKVTRGGWVPLVIAAALFFVMMTWRKGTRLLTRVLSGRSMPLEKFLATVEAQH